MSTRNSFIFRHEKFIYFFILFLYLVPIWVNKYFLTLDGPCHLYNSRILLDYILGNNKSFYSDFYIPNFSLFPNWFSHIFLALAMLLAGPIIAEKLILTIYAVLFAILIRIIIKAIKPDNTIMSFMIFPFLYHYTFQMGFYNFCFSMVFAIAYILF